MKFIKDESVSGSNTKRQAIRFFIASCIGVIFDLAISYTLATTLNIPLWIAATAGFSIAMTASYVMHELWTFRGEARPHLSLRGGGQFFGISMLTLLCRLAVITALGALLPPSFALLILICGSSVSFALSFILSRSLVFSSRPHLSKYKK
jgi:putative flippase GtrA